MYRFTRRLCLKVHSPRGINFSLSSDEAVQQIREKYGRRWFGAQLEYLDLRAPSKEFLPFYLCSGTIRGTFTGTVSYNESVSTTQGQTTSSTRYVNTGPHELDSVFEENQTQVYAGYKYNINNVHYALKKEENAIYMRKMASIDTTGATINLFEQSTMTMKEFVHNEVEAQARNTAESIIRSFHPTAGSISVKFDDLEVHIEEVTPCFVPCYVVKATYGEEEYTLYVNGLMGEVGGPYLLNALYVGRVAALSTVAVALLLTPNKVAGALFGAFASVISYYAAFYAAKWFPSYRRDLFRRQRIALQQKHRGDDSTGFRPSSSSAAGSSSSSSSSRAQSEYERSSYWDSHRFQQRWRRASDRTSSSSSAAGGAQRGAGGGDPKGYYKTLGLRGDESVNELRSAYRRLVLSQHPDVGGSTAEMTKINEAYRVLRDPKRRAEYDRQ